jgi:hypothetical protein
MWWCKVKLNLMFDSFKRTVPRDFRLQVFMAVSPKPLIIIRAVDEFSKIRRNIRVQGAPPVATKKKSSIRKVLNFSLDIFG